MIRDILQHPNKLLRKRSREVEAFTPEIGRLIQDMIDTMFAANGSGLAAIQIGVPKRVVTLNGLGGRAVALVNPRIVSSRGIVYSTEFCLSVPGRKVRIERAAQVTIEHLRQHGKETFEAPEAELAVALQHEIDHLNGVLIVDHKAARSNALSALIN